MSFSPHKLFERWNRTDTILQRLASQDHRFVGLLAFSQSSHVVAQVILRPWVNAGFGLSSSRHLRSDFGGECRQRLSRLQLYDPEDHRSFATLANLGVVFDARFDDIFEDAFPGFMVFDLLSEVRLVGTI